MFVFRIPLILFVENLLSDTKIRYFTGSLGCSTWNIKVSMARTGSFVKEETEWRVDVYNSCNCPVYGIVLSCPDFETVEPVDPSLMLRSGDGRCLINLGHAVNPGTFIRFHYAWNSQFAFDVRQLDPVGCNKMLLG